MKIKSVCTFCGGPVKPGCGKLFVKRDGTIYVFCANKCKKNFLKLKRNPKKTRWTASFAKAKKKIEE